MKEKLWNGNYLKAMVANSMIYFAFYILTPLLPIFLSERFGATKDIIGIILSGYTIAALLTRPFSGFIVDSFSRKKVLVICFALFFVFFGGYIAASTLLMFAIIRTLHGGPFGAVTVANSTVAIDVLPSSRRNEGIGFYGLSNNLAMAIAPSVGIYIYKYLQDFTILFWIALFFALIGLWVASSIQVPTKQIVRRKRQLSLDRFFLIRGWLMAVNIAFFGFCFGVLSNYLAIYSKETMGITGGTGTYFAILSIGLFASRLQGAKALRRGLLTQNAAEGMLLSMVGYTLFAAFPNVIGYYGSAILIGLGNGHMYPAFLNMFIAVARHDERGTANSSILTSWDAGFGIGILLGGVVAEYLGYSATFWMVAIAQTSGVILFFTATKKFFEQHKREEE
ncbi:MFS transporter [Prevotella sp. S7 MS 2]|uniref:MFS transporter n=1 Tax=Prevotella sp. S7 MS 2 TaxID=1287488 RepID=UPI000513C04B|nr:MFS transporter [Prevotella sp. S7 MS 2]KGI59983.1 transporter [Prevotella sp. S7 MS 2]